ncbi:hypothetical protein EEZ25_21920 [Micromonospora aurantiaca]|uniref:hypothetical protein n=1 Tax=Micromonospora aurantiaca (nom. illeg.) TaxID=47850 RepID=UPI000F41AD44|nr:hypothetical protein [Micromonospora aurantiaca]RNH99721.1 hypothetical protein EEZ25_21920 [Micromonospora aurantiaca]
MSRFLTRLTLLHLRAADRIRRLRQGGDRGSETTEKVMWIALLVTLVLTVYGVFRSKILSKINGISL